MMSGSVPGAARACSDRRWADWRPHLAMVLSNLTGKVSTDLATVTTLAEGLANRGRIYAAHSCHIIAQVSLNPSIFVNYGVRSLLIYFYFFSCYCF